MRPFGSSEVSITTLAMSEGEGKGGEIYTNMVVGLHTVMATKKGLPRVYQAKVGDSRASSGRIIVLPPETWAQRHRRVTDREKKDIPLEWEASPQFLVCNILYQRGSTPTEK